MGRTQRKGGNSTITLPFLDMNQQQILFSALTFCYTELNPNKLYTTLTCKTQTFTNIHKSCYFHTLNTGTGLVPGVIQKERVDQTTFKHLKKRS